ncbi:hypothetical protein [Sinosporangium siamense]|uniref:HTH cro/C1-type domain-containing protein n=1 Tax=Sinosporangium siamense TaxID=1367973 RepID=A0A919V9T4_9ACTN|nr:hypothetical protein [Sinosporangium siamense]GII97545.1 hypothetical protein Ssi02_77760 [Sinosporangium siamense]
MADDGAVAVRSLAEKVEWLIQHRWPQGSPRPGNNVGIATQISAATGEEISSTTVWKLRTGRSDNPQFKTLKALAAFFSVPVGYFGDEEEAEQVGDAVAADSAIAGKALNRDALRALVEMSDDARRLVADFIVSAARLEKGRD